MANTGKIFFLSHNIQTSGGHMRMNDQRANERFNHETPLIIENCDSGIYAYGRIYNYSKGGIYFESDTPFQTGTRVSFEIEKSKIGLDAGRFSGEVRWCAEISAAVVLYDYGIGVELDPKMKQTACSGELRVIRGGAGQTES
jgi:hypothetical protein